MLASLLFNGMLSREQGSGLNVLAISCFVKQESTCIKLTNHKHVVYYFINFSNTALYVLSQDGNIGSIL